MRGGRGWILGFVGALCWEGGHVRERWPPSKRTGRSSFL